MYDDEVNPEEPVRDAERETEAGDWKQQLREQINGWLDDVGELPAMEELDEEQPEPDLYSLYSELLALRNESRKGNRKVAETFSQFGETIGSFDAETRRLRDQLSRMESAQPSKGELPRAQCLALVEMLDRLHRLRAAMERRPQAGRLDLFGATKPWEESWEKLSQGFSILLTHFDALTKSAGVRPIETLNTTFDPLTMVAVATEPAGDRAPNLVIEQISIGYRWRDEVLRPAEVKITTNRP